MSVAKIQGGVVVQVDRTTDEASEGWLAVGAHVVCGMLYANGEFSAPAPDAREGVLREIARLEATVSARRLREAITTDAGKAWLANVEAQISVQRSKL